MTQPPGPSSLSAQLSRALLVTVCSFWLLGSLGVGWLLAYELAESLDSSLVQSAHRLLELAAHELDEARSHTDAGAAAATQTPAPQTAASRPDQAVSTPMVAAPAASAASTAATTEKHSKDHSNDGAPGAEIMGDFLVYQVVDGAGQLLMRSLDAPEQALPVVLQPGFSQTEDWRIYTLRHPVQDLYIHVADPMAHRRQARYESLAALLLPLLAVLPLLAWRVRRTVASRMVAVNAVAEQVRRRSGHDLSPVNAAGLPDELSDLVGNVNHLLTRLHDALQTERALAANAAHELRTPLATAQLRLANALLLPMPPASLAELQQASQAIGQLKRRTEKLLQLSRAESGAALAREPVVLQRVVDAVLQDFSADDQAYARLRVEDEEEVVVQGDVDAIAIALRNLVENALRYGGPGQVCIGIEAPGSLWVRDQGPGVDPARLDQLTQRHVRQSKDAAGFGLGLSIVKTIVDRHGGRLRLSSPAPGSPRGFEARIDWV